MTGRQIPTAVQQVDAAKIGAEGVCIRDLCYGREVRDTGFCAPCLDYLKGNR